MQNSLILLCAVTGVAVFLIIILIAAISYELSNNRDGKDGKDWLFHNFSEKAYSAFFKQKDPMELAKKLGIDMEKYAGSCRVLDIKPNLTRIIMSRIWAILCLVLFLLLGLLTVYYLMLPGVVLFFFLSTYEKSRLANLAEDRKAEIASNLPRFLDLLQAELSIGLPIESAIYIICDKLSDDMLLAREFLKSYSDMRLGTSSWVAALDKLAVKYDVDDLSEFVLDISTAHKKGVSVTGSVIRKAESTQKKHLLQIKAMAEKATSKVLLPTMIFQLAPAVMFVIIPVMSQMSGFSFI